MMSQPWVSVVTPCLNARRFLEETILSVKTQDYPKVEHIVIDGGSTDGTLDIFQEYSEHLTWISEPDRGQADAINKGWRLARGEILAYLNADDTYAPRAISRVVKFLAAHPDVDMVYGKCNVINEQHYVVGQLNVPKFSLQKLIHSRCYIPQPATFVRTKAIQRVGMMDVSLKYAMDYDLWIRIGMACRVEHIPHVLANFRILGETKTSTQDWDMLMESISVSKRYGGNMLSGWYLQLLKKRVRSSKQWKVLKRAVPFWLRRWPSVLWLLPETLLDVFYE